MVFQIAAESMVFTLPDACVDNITPPVFAGIATITAQANGSLRITWLAAVHVLNPKFYDIYIQAGTAVGLFVDANKLPAVENLLVEDIYNIKDLSPLVEGTTYHVGVKARSAAGIQDSNTVSMSAVSAGVLTDSLSGIADTLLSSLQLVAGNVVGTVDDETEVVGSVEE